MIQLYCMINDSGGVVMKVVRESNFELMRIISMIFIILWHVIMHGHVIENCSNSGLRIFLQFLQFVLIVHVNSFVLLTGYFQSKSKFKLKKIVELLIQVIFYSFFILMFAIKIGWIQNYNIVTILNALLPSSVGDYWFIASYLILYIFSDYINMFIERLTRKELKNFIIVGFFVLSIIPYLSGMKILSNSGLNFYSFIYLYIVGGYLRRYPLKDTYHFKRMTIKHYRVLLLFLFFLVSAFNYFINDFAIQIMGLNSLYSEISSRILSTRLTYFTPIVLIQSICYFEFFRTLKFKNKFMNLVSSTVFGSYLFHDNNIIRSHIFKITGIDKGSFVSINMLIKMAIITIVIFTIGFIIELLRKYIGKAIIKIFKLIKLKFIY